VTHASSQRYPAAAIVLHWAIALLLMANLAVGLRMGMLSGMDQFRMFQLHKSFGIAVLLLTVIRVLTRLTYKAPPYPAGLPGWQRRLAGTVHLGFYAIMLGLPITGWIVVSASPLNIRTLLFGLVPWPHIEPLTQLPLAERTSIAEQIGDVHIALTYATYGLIALHLAGALKHQFSGSVSIFYRMIPLASLKRNEPS